MENLTEKFKKEYIPDFKKGMRYKFRLLNLKTDEKGILVVPSYVNIVSTDVVFDPYLNGGEQVTIDCVDRIITADRTSLRDTNKILKKIAFTKYTFGELILSGDKPGDKVIFEYLCLTNRNKSNSNKPYHITPPSYVFEMVDADIIARDGNQKLRQINKAENIALNLEENKLRIVSERLASHRIDGFKYSEHLTENVLRSQLLKYAKTNPEKVIILDEEYNLSVRELIQDAKKMDILTFNRERGQLLWVKGGSVICIVPHGMNDVDVLIAHFLTPDGGEVLKMIMAQLEGEEKTSENSKVVKNEMNELESARNEYEALTGNKAHHLWKLDTLQEKINELIPS